jgi:hypothetical protein
MVKSNWNAADATTVRTWLRTPTGIKLLKEITKRIPKIKASNKEEAFMESLKKQGAEDIVEYLQSLYGDIEPELIEGRDFIDLTKETD